MIIEKKPCRLWTVLLSLQPACLGCGAVMRASSDKFCGECLERAREPAEGELGGES